MWGDMSPRVKLTGDFGNAIEGIRISNRLPPLVFAKNSWRCNFRLLQQYRPKATNCCAGSEMTRSATSGPPHCSKGDSLQSQQHAPRCELLRVSGPSLEVLCLWLNNDADNYSRTPEYLRRGCSCGPLLQCIANRRGYCFGQSSQIDLPWRDRLWVQCLRHGRTPPVGYFWACVCGVATSRMRSVVANGSVMIWGHRWQAAAPS